MSDRVHAYRLKDASQSLEGLRLPENTKVVVIPETRAADAELQESRTFTRLRRLGGYGGRTKGAAAIAAKAYEPDVRARAILRGLAYARQDLEAAGGAYDVEDVRALLRDVSRQAVDKKVAEGSLLAVPGPSGRRRFPTIQFNDDGSLVKGLKDVQAALGFSSRWAVLNFLVNGHDGLDDERPIDVLRSGDLTRVLDAAKRSGVHGA